jgi:hypothetical protein
MLLWDMSTKNMNFSIKNFRKFGLSYKITDCPSEIPAVFSRNPNEICGNHREAAGTRQEMYGAGRLQLPHEIADACCRCWLPAPDEVARVCWMKGSQLPDKAGCRRSLWPNSQHRQLYPIKSNEKNSRIGFKPF